MMTENDKEVKTKFKGPGQWRTQARELEKDVPKDKDNSLDEE
jgi:hypothetical protein